MSTRVFVLAVGAALVMAAIASSAEKKIQAKDVPPAVLQAVQRETMGSTIKGYTREVEGGRTLFEVETVVHGHSRNLLFDARGALVEVEEATTLDAVPPPVRASLESRGRVLTVETVTRGRTVTYEATVQKNGRTSEVAVAADGQPVKR